VISRRPAATRRSGSVVVVVPIGQPEAAVQLMGVAAMLWLVLEEPRDKASLLPLLEDGFGLSDADLEPLLESALADLGNASLIDQAPPPLAR